MTTSEKRRKEKRHHIIEAAAQLFAQKGFSGTVMADIAVQAGIGKGTIYEYFGGKEDLFFAVFEWFVRETSAEAKVSIAALGGSASERLAALSEAIMNSWVKMEDLFSLVMEFWAASASSHQMKQRFRQAFRQGYADFRQIVSALIRDGIARGEFRSDVETEPLAAALVGTWDALLLQAWFEDNFDPLNGAKSFMAVLIRGLAAAKPHAK